MTKSLVLIVEDHPDMLETLVKIYQLADFDTITAIDSKQTLFWLRKKAPDLVILDMELPGDLNGLDILRAIREDRKLSSTPVILHTAQPGVSNLPAAQAADLVLLKPVNPDDLIMLSHRLLNQAPARNG
jgi:two-component system, OmpR family, phosphate regulon response regulator PhoB